MQRLITFFVIFFYLITVKYFQWLQVNHINFWKNYVEMNPLVTHKISVCLIVLIYDYIFVLNLGKHNGFIFTNHKNYSDYFVISETSIFHYLYNLVLTETNCL